MVEKFTLQFLTQLRKNNYREWFHAHKAEYDKAKLNVLGVTASLLQEIHKFDTTIGLPDPRKCLFRIARDTRFSADKSPYKPNFGAIINPEGNTRCELSGYYLHIEPGNCFVSCGIYMPSPNILKAIRIKIDEEWDAFSAILKKKAFRDAFSTLVHDEDALSRVPAGFDKNAPAAEFLKLKRFYVMAGLSNKEVTGSDFVKRAVALYRLMLPLNTFLNEAARQSYGL
ncbi:MAG: DUF2461 domain-containing protein [Prevotellaceae bacterium]|jgi:uncharacterized protein (TIGR02453 family)|nr:DUF2461 domain-containing protein [Prevotellaceae bacterium]